MFFLPSCLLGLCFEFCDAKEWGILTRLSSDDALRILDNKLKVYANSSGHDLLIIIEIIIQCEPEPDKIGRFDFVLDAFKQSTAYVQADIMEMLHFAHKSEVIRYLTPFASYGGASWEWRSAERSEYRNAFNSRSRLQLSPGAYCDVNDKKRWYIGKILAINPLGDVLIYFLLYSHYVDEWIPASEVAKQMDGRGSHQALIQDADHMMEFGIWPCKWRIENCE
jgi:hypothetical protein